MVETAKEVTAEYTRQILKSVVPGLTIKEDSDTFYQVNELLKLYGAKAYHQGQQHLVEQISKLVDE